MSKVLSFDALIVGSSFDALFTALRLEAQGASVVVIEKDENVGGLHHAVKTADRPIESHVNFIPAAAETQESLAAIQKFIPDLRYEMTSLGPITFQNGHVQPFLGFGESDLQAIEQYSSFMAPDQIQLSMGLSSLTSELRSRLKGEVRLQSEVTAIELEPETAVTINGSQRIVAREIYYFDNPVGLSKLLQNSKHHVPKNFTQKLSKVPVWTAVNLVFHHQQPVTESQAIHVLYGAKDQPCVGRFRAEEGLHSSQWVSFVGQEIAADSEALGATIREMKKQIKRMYATFTETVTREHILIFPESYSTLPQGLLEQTHLPKAPAFKLGGRHYAETAGTLGDFVALWKLSGTMEQSSAAPEASL